VVEDQQQLKSIRYKGAKIMETGFGWTTVIDNEERYHTDIELARKYIDCAYPTDEKA
jgi:hypothetical protein